MVAVNGVNEPINVVHCDEIQNRAPVWRNGRRQESSEVKLKQFGARFFWFQKSLDRNAKLQDQQPFNIRLMTLPDKLYFLVTRLYT